MENDHWSSRLTLFVYFLRHFLTIDFSIKGFPPPSLSLLDLSLAAVRHVNKWKLPWGVKWNRCHSACFCRLANHRHHLGCWLPLIPYCNWKLWFELQIHAVYPVGTNTPPRRCCRSHWEQLFSQNPGYQKKTLIFMSFFPLEFQYCLTYISLIMKLQQIP